MITKLTSMHILYADMHLKLGTSVDEFHHFFIQISVHCLFYHLMGMIFVIHLLMLFLT